MSVHDVIRTGDQQLTKNPCENSAKMLALARGNLCLCLLLQLVSGKSLDLQYGYQEIEDSMPISQTSIEEVKSLEFDRLSDEAVEEICRNFKVIIHVKNPETYVNCMEPIADRSQRVILVKREADPVEGSGDPDETATSTTPENSENKEDVDSAPKTSETPEVKEEILLMRNPENPTETTSSAKVDIPTDNPGSFKGGFDNILKNTARTQNDTLEDLKGPPVILNSVSSNDQVVSNGEEAKTGESQEKPTAASPNSMLLIVIGAIGVIGALAFVYNFVKSKKESKEIDDAIRLETEGKEMKEMRPLMKNPIVQNGSKSMEYIDADPQIQVQTETRVEVN